MVAGNVSTRSRRLVVVWMVAAAAIGAVALLILSMGSSEMARAEWQLAGDVEPAEAVFRIEVVLRDSCDQVKTLVVGERDDVVRVDAFVEDSPLAALRGCEPIDQTEAVSVHLSEPLGNRRISGCSAAQTRTCAPQ